MPTGDAYSSGHLVPSLWDLHMFYLLRPILFRTCRYVSGLQSPNIPRYFLDFAFFVLSPSLKHEGTTKRQSYREISKFDLSWVRVRFVVYSFCRLPQGAKTTERQRDKMRFCGHFVLSFVRFVALYKSPKRRNEISFWRLFVLSPSIRRQNEQTKWRYPASILNRFFDDLGDLF